MTSQFNVAEAKAKLSELLDRALTGEEIVIARAGKPLARLMPVKMAAARKPGAWRDWKFDSEALLEPMASEDLEAAAGEFSDEFGIGRPRSDRS